MELVREIAEYIRMTPVERMRIGGHDVVIKREDKQVAGSFKVRGILNYVLSKGPESITVASSGNFGIAAAWVGKELDIIVNVVVPEGTPKEKIEKIESLGANLLVRGNTYEEAFMYASKRDDFVEPTHPLILKGISSIAVEVAEQVGFLDNVVLPIGTGSILVGMGKRYKDMAMEMGKHVKVFGVQPVKAPQLVKTIIYGIVFMEDYPKTELEGIAGGIPYMRVEMLKELRSTLDVPLFIEDRDVEPFLSMGEPSGVSGLAAIQKYNTLFHGDILTVVTGGNR